MITTLFSILLVPGLIFLFVPKEMLKKPAEIDVLPIFMWFLGIAQSIFSAVFFYAVHVGILKWPF